MRQFRRVLLGLSLVVSLPSWAAQVPMHPHPLPQQELAYESGVPRIISRQPESTVVFEVLSGSAGSRGAIGISVINFAPESVTVTERSITARLGQSTLVVEGQAARLQRDKRKRFWEGVAVGLTAAANGYSASQAGQQSATVDYSGTASSYGSGGYARSTYNGTATVRYTDTIAQQQAQRDAAARTKAMADRVRMEQMARQQSILSDAFAAQTIVPGGSYAGIIEYKYPARGKSRQVPLEFSVSVGRDHHTLILGVREPLSAQTMAGVTERLRATTSVSAPVLVATQAPLAPIAAQASSAASPQPTMTLQPPMKAVATEDSPYAPPVVPAAKAAAPRRTWAASDNGEEVTRAQAEAFCTSNALSLPTEEDLRSIFKGSLTVGDARCGDLYCKVPSSLLLSGHMVFTTTGAFNLITGAVSADPTSARALCVRRG
jgi:hypothetical protein